MLFCQFIVNFIEKFLLKNYYSNLYLNLIMDEILKIEEIAFGGYGIAKKNGYVVFVPYSIPGEEVKIQIKETKKDYAIGEIINIIKPSSQRKEPECRYFGKCKGCSYQHIKYEEELKIKTKQISQIFKQIGKMENPPVKNIISANSPNFYRNKVRLRYKKIKQKHLFGFINNEEKRTIDIEECKIASPLINNKIKEIRNDKFKIFSEKNIRSYNLSIVEDGTKVITTFEPETHLKVKVLENVFNYSLNSFFQVNRTIFKDLFDFISDAIDSFSLQKKTLWDLYCGVGFFGIILHNKFEEVFFVEQNKISFEFLKKNIEENNIKNAKILKGDASLAFNHYNRCDTLIVDPPRTGCGDDVKNNIIKLKPSLLIYISCNPSTLARDSLFFIKNGYKIETIQPFDFFPRTKHIECAAIFTLN